MSGPALLRSSGAVCQAGLRSGIASTSKQGLQQAQFSSSRAASSAAASAASAAQHADLPTDHSNKRGSSNGKAKAVERPAGRKYGQPLPSTHPHLFPVRLPLSGGAGVHPSGGVAHDELTPGIPASEYEERRRKLMASLPSGSVVIAMAGRVKSMSGKIFYRFRQESNFFYLTGFLEPDACLILEKKESSLKGYKMTMFVQPSGDEQEQMWNGSLTGPQGAQQIFGADEAHEMDASALLQHFKQILPSADRVYVEPPDRPSVPRQPARSSMNFGKQSSSGNILNYLSPPSSNGFDVFSRKGDFEAIVKLLQDNKKCEPLARQVEKLRFLKSPNELRLMKRAGDISAAAMTKTMGFEVIPGVTTESQLQAHFEYQCALAPGLGIKPAYVPVVAAGSNGLTIHYVDNDHVVQQGDLICMDAGAEVDGYASDITRAWPASGTFSGPQRDIYQVLLNTLKGCTALATAQQGFSLTELHRRSVEMLKQELRNLPQAGSFSDLATGVLERTLYPHYIGHWLGIDLHDTPTVERSTPLQEGVVVTIEPGLYIPFDDRFPKHYQGIGIRVEDDVAVLKEGNVVLSANVPKEVVDVEAACQRFLDASHNRQSSQSPHFALQDEQRRQQQHVLL